MSTPRTGPGIANMRDRIEGTGGTLHVDSVPDEGTSVPGIAGAALAAQGAVG